MGWTRSRPRSRAFAPAPQENPVVQAISNGDTNWLKNLLEGGANPDTPHRDTLPLHFAARRGEMHIVDLLCRHGANIDIQNGQGRTAVIEAAIGGEGKTIDALLKRGADADIADRDGHTALHHALRLSKFDIMRQLVIGGVKTDIANKAGDTPRDIAARLGVHAVDAFDKALRERADLTAQKNATLQRTIKIMSPLNIRPRRP